MHKIIMFTDGASSGNPGPGGWAVVCAYSGSDKSSAKAFELGGYEKKTTNNRMELLSFIKGLEELTDRRIKGQIKVFTDSTYLQNGSTKWLSSWISNNWRTKIGGTVLNRDLWEKIALLLEDFDVSWNHIDGHSGVPGNERCDEIATSYSRGEKVRLFEGSLDKYPLNLTSFAYNNKEQSSKKGNGGKAFSYISMIDGQIQTHKTWAECFERVRGKSGAKFRKSLTRDQENQIIKEWESRF